MTDEENPSGFSDIASRFEKSNESDGPGAKIADISSRFQTSTATSTFNNRSANNNSSTTSDGSGGATAIAARNAPIKENSEEKISTKSVADVAARFLNTEKTNNETSENSFSAVKGAFLKAESSRTMDDVETKVKAAANIFGDTVGNSKKPSPTVSRSVTSNAGESKVSRVSTEKGPGVAVAAERFQGSATSGQKDSEDGETELSSSEKFANAAKMFSSK